jgi:hypothetical protein
MKEIAVSVLEPITGRNIRMLAVLVGVAAFLSIGTILYVALFRHP